jgi:hypothetical protein
MFWHDCQVKLPQKPDRISTRSKEDLQQVLNGYDPYLAILLYVYRTVLYLSPWSFTVSLADSLKIPHTDTVSLSVDVDSSRINMESSRITVHLPLNESPDAVLDRQQSGIPEEESIWTDFTILGDAETAQQGPDTPSNTTSASHIPDNPMSSAAEDSRNFANDRSFRHESYRNAPIDPAAATRETDSMAARIGNPDTDTSTVEIPTSSHTGVSRYTAVPAPLTSIGTGFDATPYIDQSFDSAVPAGPDSSLAYTPLKTTPATDTMSVASKMYEHSAVELENYLQSCGGDLFSCKRGGLPFALKPEYQERLLWIMCQLDLDTHTVDKWTIFSPRYHSPLRFETMLRRRPDAVNVANFVFRCCQFILEKIHTDSCPYSRAQLHIHGYTDNTRAKRDLGRCYEAIRDLNLSSLTLGHRAGPRLSIETSKSLIDQAHTAYTTSTSSDHFSQRMSDEGWGDLSKYPGKRSYEHMSSEWLESLDGWLGRSVITKSTDISVSQANTISEATDTSKVVKTASLSEQVSVAVHDEPIWRF